VYFFGMFEGSDQVPSTRSRLKIDVQNSRYGMIAFPSKQTRAVWYFTLFLLRIAQTSSGTLSSTKTIVKVPRMGL
jgi:hypothetical protein